MVAAGGYMAPVAAGAPADNLEQGYLDAMQSRVFDPIGMSATTFSLERVQTSGNFASPHEINLQGAYQAFDPEVENRFRPVLPSGMIWSNARDMAGYLLTELNRGIAPDGQRVVSAENLAYTWQPYTEVAQGVQYGLGWMSESFHGIPILFHQGNTSGFTSEVAFSPDAGAGILVLTNARLANDLTRAVRNRFFELALGLPVSQGLTIQNSPGERQKNNPAWMNTLDAKIDPDLVAPYVRTFTNPILGNLIVESNGTQLMINSGEFRSVFARIQDESLYFAAVEPPLLMYPIVFELKLDEQGDPIIVFDTGAASYVFTKK